MYIDTLIIINMYVYIYIYTHMYSYKYIYIYMCFAGDFSPKFGKGWKKCTRLRVKKECRRTEQSQGRSRRRENMVGVSMVLAEFVKFKHGLYKSCGIECFEGIMLEPCLLQPCFHVAG